MRQNDHPDKVDINLDNEPIGESPIDTSQTPAAPVPQESAARQTLVEQVAQLQAEKEQLLDTLVRRQADFENYKKRIERERKEDSSRVVAVLVESVLPVLDAFERALAAHGDPAYEDYRKGFELIYRQLWEALERYGLARIEARGKPFDPYYHQAVESLQSSDQEEGTVVEELQRGYKFRERVLRPAMVRVAVKPAPQAPLADPPVN